MIREVLTLDRLGRMDTGEAAALLLVRRNADDYDGADEAVLDDWLAADPTHFEAWARAASVCAHFDSPDDNAVLNDMREAARSASAAPTRWGFAIAASIAVIAATGGALLLDRQGGADSAAPGTQIASVDPAKPMLATARGEHRSYQLADASTVTLNTESAVAVAFRPGGERRLELIRGQAYFKVTPDQSRPFVVAADGQTVTALGTQFEVRAEASSLRVVLVEGRVSVAPARGSPVVMRAGQQLIAGPQGVTLSAADVGAVSDWQRGIITFKGTTLAAAVTELNRYSRTQLKVDDPRLARLTVSGVFQTNDASRFARTIAEIYPVKVVAGGGDTLRIVPAPAAAS